MISSIDAKALKTHALVSDKGAQADIPVNVVLDPASGTPATFALVFTEDLRISKQGSIQIYFGLCPTHACHTDQVKSFMQGQIAKASNVMP